MTKYAQCLDVGRGVVLPILVYVMRVQPLRRATALAEALPMFPRLSVKGFARGSTFGPRVGAGKRAETAAHELTKVLQRPAPEASAQEGHATHLAEFLGGWFRIRTHRLFPFRVLRYQKRALIPGSGQTHQPSAVRRVQLAATCCLGSRSSRSQTSS